jgi:hypothetical protein
VELCSEHPLVEPMTSLPRLVSCINCKSAFPTSQAMALFLKSRVPECDRRVLQSMTDGFSSFPLKQMKSVAYQASTPVNRISQFLEKGNVSCPKCGKVHWR